MNTPNHNNFRLGLFMRMAVEGAIKVIQGEAANYVRIGKTHYDGTDTDLVTSADLKAQAHYDKLVQEAFPDECLVGEENNLGGAIRAVKRFVVDPVDGTKAFGRNQSTGVATMFAHVNCNEVDAVCVGDINTGEIYQFAPGHKPTRTRFGVTTPLPTDWKTPLAERYALLSHPADDFPVNIQKMIRIKQGGVFKDMEVTSGSIGIIAARLWKGEVGMIVLYPAYETPWDGTPIIGMNRQLGIVHVRVHQETGLAELFDPEPPTEVKKRNFTEILMHQSFADEVVNWLNANRN